MKTAFFDIETNGLLDTVSAFHCGVVKADDISIGYTGIDDFTDVLDSYDVIIGHNAIRYDIPALKRLKPGWTPKARVIDTLVLSRLMYPDRSQHPAGGNSIENWGKYFGKPKKDHTDFSVFSFDMLDYCKQDVDILEMIFHHVSNQLTTEAGGLELAVAQIIADQYDNGVGFDMQGAQELRAVLSSRSFELTEELQKAFPPRRIEMKTKVKEIPFNPGSRDQIASSFILKYRWKPKQFTETGKPQIDESILDEMPYPEAKLLSEYLLVEKRLSQIDQWIEACRDGIVHGDVNTNGAVSGRMTHSSPNMAQVPRCGSPYGKECRALFKPTKAGRVVVGADASGLELRMFAHYLARFDSGAYGKIVCDGDIHTHNQKAAGLQTRDQAKTFIYGMLYGAGDAKIGKIVEGTAGDGNRLRESFKRQVPAYATLCRAIEYKAASAKSLRGLDGRILPIRSAHSALNLLLQSAGAVIMKKALQILDTDLKSLYRNRYNFMLNIHDEWQIECDVDIADAVGRMAAESITKAGEHFKLQCPLKGEYKIGNNWSETH